VPLTISRARRAGSLSKPPRSASDTGPTCSVVAGAAVLGLVIVYYLPYCSFELSGSFC